MRISLCFGRLKWKDHHKLRDQHELQSEIQAKIGLQGKIVSKTIKKLSPKSGNVLKQSIPNTFQILSIEMKNFKI